MPIAPRLLCPILLAGLAISACAPEGDSGGDSSAAAETGSEPEAREATGSLTLAESGWLVVGEDGAVYTTMLDPEGTYRDFRNGEPLQTGEWEKREAGELCFIPSDEGKAGDCWTLGELERDNTVRATDSEDRPVELRKISYVGPGEGDGEGDGDADSGE